MENLNGWKVEVKVTVKGPKEGAIIGGVTYEDTTKEVALAVQQAVSSAIISLNG